MPSDEASANRRRTQVACVFCRYSHMTCDNERPCRRCVRRGIGHLCHNPPSHATMQNQRAASLEALGSEYDPLDRLMSSLISAEEQDLDLGPEAEAEMEQAKQAVEEALHGKQTKGVDSAPGQRPQALGHGAAAQMKLSTDEFMLAAADPQGRSGENRLHNVYSAKQKAGLLRPYDYAAGYDRLRRYMDSCMSDSSKRRVMKPLNELRPEFRAVAQRLSDADLAGVEESFEMLLLDYDRVFASAAMPSCLWRRTGEIYKANKEFAELVDCSIDDLQDGKLAIYELMTEESAVLYWEKYGDVAFKAEQKAVMSSCNLRARSGRKRRQCCFCFTIRRDRYDIPYCIVGNFIPMRKWPY